jgi:tetrahydromethanopterin S-methyltransferase subunit D
VTDPASQPSPTVDETAAVTSDLITLARVKTHLRLGSSDREDEYLKGLIGGAVGAIGNATGRDIMADLPTLSEQQTMAAAQAALMLVGHWYANRETSAQNLSELPLAVTWLIAPLRRFVV